MSSAQDGTATGDHPGPGDVDSPEVPEEVLSPQQAEEASARSDVEELPPSISPKGHARPLPAPQTRDEKQDQARQTRQRRIRGLSSWLVGLVVVLALAALIKTYGLQTFEIPSGSMENTLTDGDRVVVTMYDSHKIERGDVVVFLDPGSWLNVDEPTGVRGVVQDLLIATHLLPEGSGHHLIKRVIGMPGDHVVSDGAGTVSVNGTVLHETYVKEGVSPSDVAFDVVVPPGCIWVMGDNRANSADSRFHQGDAYGGAVPLDNVVGVAKGVIWPLSHLEGLGAGTDVFAQVPEATTSARS